MITKQEANEKIARLVQEAYAALAAAEAIADESEISFTFEPAYGMGGWYDGVEQSWASSSSNC